MNNKVKKNCFLNIKSSKLMTFLSLSTMTLLILSSIVIISIIKITPVVILGLGQLQQGQRDMILYPKLKYLNSTKLSQVCKLHAMPRISFPVIINQQKYAKAWLMDFTLQRQQHLGSLGGHQGIDHEYVYAYEGLGFAPNTEINLEINNFSMLSDILLIINQSQSILWKQQIIDQLQHLIYNNISLKGRFTVKQTFKTASGKFGVGTVSDFIYLDIKYAFLQIIRQTYRIIRLSQAKSKLIQFLTSSSFNIQDWAQEATINLPNRIQVYSNPDYEQVYHNLNKFAQTIMKQVGPFAFVTQMSIGANMIQLGYVGMFFGVMLKLIIITLFILSVIMMNNMLTMAIQKKQFDFAILKVMGADKTLIIVNILIDSLKYVVFANALAFPLSYVTLQLVTLIFEDFFGYRYQVNISFQGIAGGIIIGILVPVFSSILPILAITKNDLAQNLYPLRNKIQAVKSQIYVQGRQFPIGKLIFGVLATTYGIMIYYLLPKSLINQNMGLMLSLFFIVLQGLMLGLIIISYSFQYTLQRILTHIVFFWADKTDIILTIKNLSSHRLKNRRSSLVYALSVSFLIFISASVQLQLETMYYDTFRKRGSCYIEIRGDKINPEQFNMLLPQIQSISDWSYMSWQMIQYMKAHHKIDDILISDKARLFFARNAIYGVSPNQINTLFYDKVSVYKTNAKPPYDPYSYLYSQQGFMTCTISKYLAKKFAILNGPNQELYINFYNQNSVRRIAMNYSSVFDKKVGLFYSSIISYSQVGISFDTYRAIAGIPAYEQVPIRYVKVQLSDPSKASQVAGRIRQKINMAQIDWVWDYSQLKANFDKIQQMLQNAFKIIFIIVLTISFFSLVSTTYINIVNQTNQIAILMIIGLEKTKILKIYTYQSFVVVLSSCIIGILVGYAVVWMCSLQIQLFSDIPIQIEITGLPIIILAILLSSFLSTTKPLGEVFGQTISQTMNFSR